MNRQVNSKAEGNKRIAKNTLVLYIRMLFVMGVTIYTSRVVLEQLGVTDYGIYNVVGSVVTIFTFISQALGNATNRFIVFSIGTHKASLQHLHDGPSRHRRFGDDTD